MASKIEAFNKRGDGDGRRSADFEDVVYVLNNRTSIWKELTAAHDKVKAYLKAEFQMLLNNPYMDEWISSHLEYSERGRIKMIIRELKAFAEGSTE